MYSKDQYLKSAPGMVQYCRLCVDNLRKKNHPSVQFPIELMTKNYGLLTTIISYIRRVPYTYSWE